MESQFNSRLYIVLLLFVKLAAFIFIFDMKTHVFKLILIVIVFSSTSIRAQTLNTQNNNSFIDDVRFGGGIGFSFGNNFFSGTLAPFALYEINPYLLTGVGLNLSYSSFNNSDLFVYGGSLIGLARPMPKLQFSVEFEQLRVNRSFNDGDFKDNYWYPALFLGVGYSSGPVTVGIRYDILYDDDKSIYANAYMPFVRVLF